MMPTADQARLEVVDLQRRDSGRLCPLRLVVLYYLGSLQGLKLLDCTMRLLRKI